MMEGLQISIPQRLMLLRSTLVISLIVGLLLSTNLWAGQRYFPTTPFLDLPSLLPPYDFTFLIIVIMLLFSSLLLKMQRLLIFVALAILAWLCMLDISRVQPWFYIYFSMLAVFIFYNGRVDDPNKFTSFFIILQIIIASVYFFSGLSQLNTSFLENEFPKLISPLRNLLSDRQFNLFIKAGSISPYILMFIGVGLIISPIRYLAIAFAALIHILLIVFLFPSRSHLNYALWLSNISFLLMVFLLFSGKTKQRYFSPTFLFQHPLFYIVIVLFVALPFVNLQNQWPDFLSSNFRSGANRKGQISVSQQIVNERPLYERHLFSRQGNRYILNHEQWFLEEFNSDFFPDERVFNSICSYLALSHRSAVKEIELKYLPDTRLLRKP